MRDGTHASGTRVAENPEGSNQPSHGSHAMSTPPTIDLRILDPRIRDSLPAYATPGAAGMDLRALSLIHI